MFRSYFRDNIPDDEVINKLDTRYPYKDNKWTTPFGLSFAKPDYRHKRYGGLWYYIYNEEGTKLSPYSMTTLEKGGQERTPQEEKDNTPIFACGWLEKQEILHLITIFDKKDVNTFNVYQKSTSIMALEYIFDKPATLDGMHCLQWHFETDQFSCCNNPYDLLHVYASTGDEFELFIREQKPDRDESEEPIEYIGYVHLIEELKDRGFIPKTKICDTCKDVSFDKLKHCGRCKSTFYCNIECQKEGWNKGHKLTCIKK